jgi:5-methylcytosine-specific restriction endonuclease McrA
MGWQGQRRGFPPHTRTAILQAQPTCQLQLPGCTHTSTEADHITPTAQGGTNHPTNGRGVCHTCHTQITKTQAAAGTRHTAAKARYPKPPPPALTSSSH